MKPLITMRAALESPDIFGKVFDGESWSKWRILLIAMMGEQLRDDERPIFHALTGREREPLKRVDEFWAIMGRRSGKTRAIAVLSAYLAALVDFQDVLAPGERATLMVISASLWQAGKAFQYLDGIFGNVPALKRLVTGQTADTISLSTRVDIECRPASFRTSRSGTSIGVVSDELAFWRSDESANPDKEILNAARPSLATTGGMLAVISSPYARRGELHNAFKRDFGPKGDPAILVAKAASLDMNPTLPEDVVRRAYDRDPAAASAEYGAEFRSDVESYISLEVVEACVEPGCHELAYTEQQQYVASLDAAGGSGQDSMTWAVAHKENDIAVLDVIGEVKPPFSPQAVVEQAATTFKAYRISRVKADKWGSGFVAESLAKFGITCEQNADPKSTVYGELLPLLTSHKVRLLDNPRLISQLCGLERKTARGGRDSIDHPQGAGGHDDVINAAALALVTALTKRFEQKIVAPIFVGIATHETLAPHLAHGPEYRRNEYGRNN